MLSFEAFDQLVCQFDTRTLPPPFCFRYKIIIAKTAHGPLKIKLNLEYYDREELNEEEIFDEGYTLEDNFSWQGELPDVWEEEIKRKLQSTNWKKKYSTVKNGSEFKLSIGEKDQVEDLYPAEPKIWENFCQEIIQAVFELGKKEAPLFISYVNKISNSHENEVNFKFFFSDRTIQISGQKHSGKSLPWEEGQKLLKYIYKIDYLPENGYEKIPKKPGNYISPGDSLWYKLDLKNNKGNTPNQTISKLVETLNTYVT